MAIAGGLFHPNCKHRAMTYYGDDIANDQPLEKEHPDAETKLAQLHQQIQQQKRIATGSMEQEKINLAQKRFKNGLKYDTTIPDIVCGARNPLSKKAEEHAKKYYGLVRSMTTDAKKISESTGLSEKENQDVKNFIFNDKHDLGNGRFQRFDPDYMMAESWRRLMEGNPEQHDLTMINHEIMEHKLMLNGMTQDEAHILTTKTYNYDKEAKEYYAKIKKYKK